MSYEKVMKSYKCYTKLRTSYEKLQKVTKSYKRVIGSDLEASFYEILENGLPIRAPRQPNTKFHFRASGRCRSSEKPLHRQKCTFCKGLTSPPKKLTKTHSMAPTSISCSAGEICPFPSPTSPAAEKYASHNKYGGLSVL